MTDSSKPPVERPPEQIAIGMIQDAEAYRVAAVRTLPREAPAQDNHLTAPAWHLLCHAAELALKAYLLSNGADPSARKGGITHSSIRHNLFGLYEMAIDRGFEAPDDDFGQLMEWLSPYHGAHAFRYRRPGRARLPAPFFIAEVLESVISDTARIVRIRWTEAHGDRSAIDGLRKAGLTHARPPSEAP